MTKLSIVSNAVPTGKFFGRTTAQVVNISIDTKEVVSAFAQVTYKHSKSSYINTRSNRKPLSFDINKF
jgi:hypothetical protein